MTVRGLDGLTPEMLRASRAAWWDEEFTRALIEPLGANARTVVDVGCGLGQGALAVLPLRRELRWIGVDADLGRLAAAAHALAAAGLAERASLLQGPAEALPFDADRCDAVLFVATLQHLPDPAVALAEAHRVLRPGGWIVAAEPDNLGQHLYLDGILDDVDRAYRALFRKGRAARNPRDPMIGPRLPGLLGAAGFENIAVRAHLVQVVRWEVAATWLARKREDARNVARSCGLDDECDEVTACDAALAHAVVTVDPDRQVCTVHTVPMFVVAAVRPAAGPPTVS